MAGVRDGLVRHNFQHPGLLRQWQPQDAAEKLFRCHPCTELFVRAGDFTNLRIMRGLLLFIKKAVCVLAPKNEEYLFGGAAITRVGSDSCGIFCSGYIPTELGGMG